MLPRLRRQVLRRNLFGVDLNGAAVRLTELRLWLAVVAADRSDRPERVQPLPNLDCLIRQGDSLFDPAGSVLPARTAPAPELAALRKRIVVATGAAKRAALRELVRTEARIAEVALADAEASARASVAECLEGARSADLFGGRRGLDRAGVARLAELRRELRQVRVLRRALARERQVPCSTTGCSSRTSSPPAGSTSRWAILRGSELKRCPRSCVAALRPAIGGGGLAEEATPTDRTSRSPFSSVPSSSPGPVVRWPCWCPQRWQQRGTAPSCGIR